MTPNERRLLADIAMGLTTMFDGVPIEVAGQRVEGRLLLRDMPADPLTLLEAVPTLLGALDAAEAEVEALHDEVSQLRKQRDALKTLLRRSQGGTQ